MNPVAKGWLRASIDLWRRLCKVPSDSLLGMAVRESLASYAGEGVGSAPKSWAGRFMHTIRSLSQGRDADGTIAEFLATNGLAQPDNKIAAIPWVKVWGAWDTMLQEPWDKVAAYANPRQSVSSNLIKLSTYHSWFMTGDIPQEEFEAGYPQGMQRYIRHTSGKQTNKNLRCGNRKGLLSRNDQTHHRMGPKTMESIPPSKRNTQADIQLRTRQIVAPANKSPAGD